jgi:hypothetical protein
VVAEHDFGRRTHDTKPGSLRAGCQSAMEVASAGRCHGQYIISWHPDKDRKDDDFSVSSKWFTAIKVREFVVSAEML